MSNWYKKKLHWFYDPEKNIQFHKIFQRDIWSQYYRKITLLPKTNSALICAYVTPKIKKNNNILAQKKNINLFSKIINLCFSVPSIILGYKKNSAIVKLRKNSTIVKLSDSDKQLWELKLCELMNQHQIKR